MIPSIEFIINFESGNATHEETISEFQKMIDTGVVWHLQGFYGRTAAQLIEAGYCTPCENSCNN